MSIKPIKTEKDYQTVLQRIQDIFDAKPWTSEWDELEVLAILINDYESKSFPISNPDPIEAIKFRIDQLNMNTSDLGEILWYKSRASEILNRKRKLSLQMIRNISQKLHIPTNILIQAY